jgi:hypothetical protein
MPPIVEAERARRYLLRTLPEGEEERLEREYVASADVLDQVTLAEEALIDAYLDRELPARERERFEQIYLSSSAKRLRVETIRRLRAAAGATGENPSRLQQAGATPAAWRRYAPLAAAALVVIAAVFATWRARDGGRSAAAPQDAARTAPTPVERPSPTTPPPATPTQVVALALSPIATRSASTARPLVIPSGTDAVELDLVVEFPPASATRVDLATVAGIAVWSGTPAPLPARNAIKVHVPASRLPPDDYILTLYGLGPSGREAEQHRYFLRVRAR